MASIRVELDKPRTLKFDTMAVRLATQSLQAFMPPAGAKLSHGQALQMVLGGDPDAIASFLAAGLYHENKRMTGHEVNELLDLVYGRGDDAVNELIQKIVAGVEATGMVKVQRAPETGDDAPGPLRAVSS